MDAIEAMKSMFKSIMEGKVQWDRDVFRLGVKALVSVDYSRASREFGDVFKHIISAGFKDFINNKGSDLRLQVPGRHLRVLGYFFCAACAVEIRNLGKVVYSDEAARYFAGMASRLLSGIDLAEETESLLEFPFTGSASTTGSVKSSSWNDFQELTNRIFSLAREEYDREIREEEKKDLQISEAKAFTSYLLTADEEYSRKEAERLLRWREYPVLFVNGTMGILGTIRVEMLKDGIGDFYSKSQKMFYINADSDFLASIQTAWKYARTKLPEGVEHIDVVWDIRTADFRHIFCDKSAGAPTALATRQLLLNEPLPNDYLTFFTGEVYKSGKIGEVGGITEKITAALRKDVKIIILPQENWKTLGGKLKNSKMANYIDLRNEINSKLGGLDNIKPVNTVDEAAQYASGLPKKVKEYLEWMRGESEKLNILSRLSKEIKLEDIYISVRTTKFEKRDYQEERKREMERIKGNRDEEKDLLYKDRHTPRGMGDGDRDGDRDRDREKQEEEKVKVFQWKDERKKYSKCALLGDPGAGKSTLLRWESCQTIKEGLKTIEKGGKGSDIEIPIFIRLAEISGDLKKSKDAKESSDLMDIHINSKLKPVFDNAVFIDFIKKQAKAGKVCFLLDAMDEVPDGEKTCLNESLKNLEILYPKCRFLMTSRIVGYSGCPFRLSGKSGGNTDKADDYTLTLVPFGWKETERFVKSWFHENDEAKNKGNNFLKDLRKNREMKGLSQNPLLLTLMCAVYEENSGDGNDEGKIPVKRSRLYDKCIENFLTIWRTQKDNAGTEQKHKLKLDAKKNLYSDMAFYFFSQDKEFFSEQEMLSFIKSHDKVKEFTGSPNFKEDSIVEWEGFLRVLKEHKDKENSHMNYIYLRLSGKRQQLIESWQPGDEINNNLKKIVLDLDRILSNDEFYEERIFADLEINNKEFLILKENLENLNTEEIKLLNYYLIESIFPKFIQNLYITEILSDGILVPAGYDNSGISKFMFLHRTFQEYLTACALTDYPRRVGQSNTESSPIVREIMERAVKESSITGKKNIPADKLNGIHYIESQLWNFEWWEEVILLMASRFGEEAGKAGDNGYKALGTDKHNRAEDLVEMLLEHDDDRPIEKAFGDPIEDKEPLRQLLLPAAGCCREGNVEGSHLEKTLNILNQMLDFKILSFLACQALGETGSDKAVEPLIKALGDMKNNYRYCKATAEAAAKALGQIGSDKAVESLIEALGDHYSSVCRAAAGALGQIGSDKAVEPLIKAMGYRMYKYRDCDAAAEALDQIGSDKVVECLLEEVIGNKGSGMSKKVEAAKVLGKIGPDKAVEPLIEALGDRESRVRKAAAEALGEIGSDKAVERLIEVLGDEDLYVRMMAAEALGQIGSDKAVGPLIKVIGDEHWYVRKAAAKALGKIGSDEALNILIKAMGDESGNVSYEAAWSLGKIGSDEALNTLIKVLGDRESKVREAAAEALGKISSDEALNTLIKVLGDRESKVREAAAYALGKISSDKAVEALIKAMGDEQDVREAAAYALGEIGSDEAVKPLTEVLRDEYYRLRRIHETYSKKTKLLRMAAIIALGKIGSQEAVPMLIEALNDEVELQKAAIIALGKIGAIQSVPSLEGKLKSRYSDVGVEAVIALRKIGTPGAIQLIGEALMNPVYHLQWTKGGATWLSPGYTDKEPLDFNKYKDYGTADYQHVDVQQQAAEELSIIGNRQAIEYLTESFIETAEREAAIALGKIGSQIILPKVIIMILIEILAGARDPYYYYRALSSILNKRRIKIKTINPMKVHKLDNVTINMAILVHKKEIENEKWWRREAAAEALSEIGGKETLELLVRALKDEDEWVRSSVARALGNFNNEEAISALIEALNDKKLIVRLEAVRALGNIGESKAIQALEMMLKEEYSSIRVESVESLSKIGDKKAIPALVETLSDKDWNVHLAAEKAIINIDDIGSV